MQIKLFPEDETPTLMDADLHTGKIGPIQFAVTPTSHALLLRALSALSANKEPPEDEIDP